MNEVESLEELVAKPASRKRPSNIALWVALIFANLVVMVLDTISALTVFWMTGNYGYGIAAFLAGAIPLIMHELLYLRAYASQNQRVASLIGAGFAVLSVVVIGILSAIVNVSQAYEVSWAQYAVIIAIVLLMSVHGMIAAYYFYSDEGIRAAHNEAEMVAYHQTRLRHLQRADEILTKASEAQKKRALLIQKHGSREALAEVLRQLTEDANGDGIPDVLQRTRRNEVYAQEVRNISEPDEPPNSRGRSRPPSSKQ